VVLTTWYLFIDAVAVLVVSGLMVYWFFRLRPRGSKYKSASLATLLAMTFLFSLIFLLKELRVVDDAAFMYAWGLLGWFFLVVATAALIIDVYNYIHRHEKQAPR